MGLRFRKSVKIFPGIRLNISKTGISTSIGGRGATINLGKKGKTTTIGWPGTGISHSTYEPNANEYDEEFVQMNNQEKKSGCMPILGGLLFLGLLAQCMPKENTPIASKTNIVSSSNDISNSVNEQFSNTIDKIVEPTDIKPLNKTQPSKNETQYISVNNARAYAEPNAESSPTKIFYYREPVKIVEKGVNWTKVIQNGMTFWVLTQQLTSQAPPKITKKPEIKSSKQTPQSFKSVSVKSANRKDIKSAKKKKSSVRGGSGGCPCGSGRICTGPRGGRYCLTASGNKDYGH